MPTVPRAQRRVQAAAATPVFQQNQNINAPREAFGGGEGLIAAGEAIANAGDVVGDLLIKQKDQEDTNEAKKLELELAAKYRELLYGTPQDPNSGYFATRGQNAVDGRAGVEEQLAKARADVLSRASNPQVLQALEVPTATRLERERTNVGQYFIREQRTAWDNTSEARLASISSDVAARARNPNAEADIAEGLNLMVNEVHDMGTRNGWGQQQIRGKVREAHSAMLTEVINRHLAEKDARSAHAVFSKYSHLIDGGLHDNLITKMQTGLDLQHATEQFDLIISKTDNFKDQLAMARAIEDPKVRKTATNMIEAHYQNNKRVQEAEQQQRFEQVFTQVAGGMNPAEISVEDRVGMTVTQNNFLDAAYKRWTETGSAWAASSDQALYNRLNRMTPQEFMAEDMMQHVGSLDEEDWKRMSNRQAQFIKEASAAKSTGAGGTAARTSTQVRAATMRAFDMNEAQQYHFGKAFDEQIAIIEEEKGRKASASEAQSVADALTVEFVSDAGWFGRLPLGVQGDRPLFLPKDMDDPSVAEEIAKEFGVRTQDMPLIVQILQENQMEINRENIQKVIQAGQ